MACSTPHATRHIRYTSIKFASRLRQFMRAHAYATSSTTQASPSGAPERGEPPKHTRTLSHMSLLSCLKQLASTLAERCRTHNTRHHHQNVPRRDRDDQDHGRLGIWLHNKTSERVGRAVKERSTSIRRRGYSAADVPVRHLSRAERSAIHRIERRAVELTPL